MDAPSALVLRELGGDPDGHVARRVTPALVEGASLVLTADCRAPGGPAQGLAAGLPPHLHPARVRAAGRRPPAPGRADARQALAERVREVAAARGVTAGAGRGRVPTTSATRSVPRWTSCARPAPRSATRSNAVIASLGLVAVPAGSCQETGRPVASAVSCRTARPPRRRPGRPAPAVTAPVSPDPAPSDGQEGR